MTLEMMLDKMTNYEIATKNMLKLIAEQPEYWTRYITENEVKSGPAFDAVQKYTRGE